MTKNPSVHRTSDLVHYRQAKANQKKRNMAKLREDIAELERQLKHHPLAVITLNARIKEKRKKLDELSKKIKKTQRAPTQVAENAEEILEKRSKKGVRGLSNLALKERSLQKAVERDQTLRSTRHRRHAPYSERDVNASHISPKFRTTKCVDAGKVGSKEKIGSGCHGQVSLRKQDVYLCKWHYDVRCGMYLGL